MQSLNRHVVQERISRTSDVSVGTNGNAKNQKDYFREMRGSVELPDPNALGADAFIARMGKRK